MARVLTRCHVSSGMHLTSEEVNDNELIPSFIKAGLEVILRQLAQVREAVRVRLCTERFNSVKQGPL